MNERQLNNTISFLLGGLASSYVVHEFIIHRQQKVIYRISETLDFVSSQQDLHYKMFKKAYEHLTPEEQADLWDDLAFDVTIHQGMIPERILKHLRELEQDLRDKEDE